MIWIAGAGSVLLLVLLVVGLVDLVRNRHTMETWQVVMWAVLIVVIPVFGLVAYLFWRLARTETMQDAIDFHDEHSDRRGRLPTTGR